MLFAIHAVSALHRDRPSVVEDWLKGLPACGAEVETELRTLLSYLRDLPRDEWVMPAYRQTLQGYPKIGEVRFKLCGTQFRVFGFFGPTVQKYTLLCGATEKMQRYNPPSAMESADNLREKVLRGERKIEKFAVTVA